MDYCVLRGKYHLFPNFTLYASSHLKLYRMHDDTAKTYLCVLDMRLPYLRLVGPCDCEGPEVCQAHIWGGCFA
jgi:hypothetical protein